MGIHEELKANIYEEEMLISDILNKKNIDSNVLVVENDNTFIGYAPITRESKTIYNMGKFVIKLSRRNLGYGNKKCAVEDSCDIKLKCINSSQSFFLSQGFINTNTTNKSSLFIDYKIIESKRRKIEDKNLKSFLKYLDSPLFKYLNDMI